LNADWLFRDALVVDGTGAAVFRADVAVTGGSIAAVGHLAGVQARHTVAGAGRVLAPGFIDIHTHADVALLADGCHAPKVMQGVTTEVFCNCGIGFAPLTDHSAPLLRDLYGPIFGPDPGVEWAWRSVAEYLERLDGRAAVNVAFLVPHAALRAAVMGLEARPASEDELSRMGALLRQGMEAGAFGFTTSPWYAPMNSAQAHEVRTLMRVAGDYGGLYATHMRSYTDRLVESLAEEIGHAEATGVKLQVAHLACVGKPNWGRSAQLLEMIAAAHARGVDVWCDTYPYLAGCTLLYAMLPEWVTQDGPQGVLPRLRDPELRARAVADLAAGHVDWSRGQVCGVASAANKALEGRSFAEVARERGVTPDELVCDLVVEEELRVSFLAHTGSEEDLRAILASPYQVVGSDGLHLEGKTHPRLYGTFPRVLGRYVRESRVLTLEQAVYKMTGAPAGRLGLSDRGVLRPGAAADLVLFDPATVQDTATYEDPCRYPDGIELVMVNGVPVKEGDRHTGALPGRVLRKGMG